jgi:hypothetical protein
MKEHITELLHRDPFVPFRIVLTSGQGYDVHDPDLVAMGESTTNVYFQKSDRYATLRLIQVASTEILEAAH